MAVVAVPSVVGSMVSMPGRRTGYGRPSPAWRQGTFQTPKALAEECWSAASCWPGLPGYFGRDRDTLIVLLGGGTKARQQRDIEQARELWQEYRRRKQQEM